MVKMGEHVRSCSAACSQFDTNKLIKILKKKKKKVKMVNFMLYILSHLKQNKTKNTLYKYFE